MRYFFAKLINLWNKKAADAEIIGDVKFYADNTPYFTVKMHGCHTLVDIDLETIIEKFTDKFSSREIRNATKVFMKYRNRLQLTSIENNFAILHNKKDDSYQILDLSDNLLLRSIDLNLLSPEDAFKLGSYFERMRQEKDRKWLNLTKASQNLIPLSLVTNRD